MLPKGLDLSEESGGGNHSRKNKVDTNAPRKRRAKTSEKKKVAPSAELICVKSIRVGYQKGRRNVKISYHKQMAIAVRKSKKNDAVDVQEKKGRVKVVPFSKQNGRSYRQKCRP